MTRAEKSFTDALLEWLNHRMAPPSVVIGLDTPLFAHGLINSIRILEMIAWTEREIGSVIPDLMIRMDNFATPRRIGEVFARAEADAHR